MITGSENEYFIFSLLDEDFDNLFICCCCCCCCLDEIHDLILNFLDIVFKLKPFDCYNVIGLDGGEGDLLLLLIIKADFSCSIIIDCFIFCCCCCCLNEVGYKYFNFNLYLFNCFICWINSLNIISFK